MVAAMVACRNCNVALPYSINLGLPLAPSPSLLPTASFLPRSLYCSNAFAFTSLGRRRHGLLPAQFCLPATTGRNLCPEVVAKVVGSCPSEDDLIDGRTRTPLDQPRKLSERWREIHGENNWEGLLDPIDPVLRSEIIRYGEFAQVCYDAFDFDTHSKYCGSCKYNSQKLFEKLDKADCGYTVTKYLYATSSAPTPLFFRRPVPQPDIWSHDSNWIGFIAVTSAKGEIKRLGRRDILVAWRGTVTKAEWTDDIQDFLKPAGLDPRRQGAGQLSEVKVESGFLYLYVSQKSHSRYNATSVRQQLQTEIRRLLAEYKGEELSVTVTGHSLGAALAVLSAYDLGASNLGIGKADQGRIPVAVFSFAGPRVGNRAFRDGCEEVGVKVLRVANVHDIVPRVPGMFVNETRWQWVSERLWPWAYFHVGTELKLNSESSVHLKRTNSPTNHHNLEALLHLVDGGKRRDIALVNKSADFLVAEAMIPPSWWQEKHKGLVRNHLGRWVQPDRDDENVPGQQ